MFDALPASCLKGHRFPREIIAYAVRVYLALQPQRARRRGVARQARRRHVLRDDPRLVGKFGMQFAAMIRRARPRPNSKWHLDEVVIRISGRTHWLWRAVDADGETLDILVQPR